MGTAIIILDVLTISFNLALIIAILKNRRKEN